MSHTAVPNAQSTAARRAEVAAPLLSVQDLAVTFAGRHGGAPVHAVQGVSFDIAAGETLGLVGESGSGKTTTGRAVLRLQPTNGGTVRLLGKELTTLSAGELRGMRRHMQFVLQNPYSSLHPRMTVARILAEPLHVHRSVEPHAISARIAQLMELVGLDPALVGRYPHEFSGGQRQRIVIARALAVNPDFVVCDEPVSALDVRTQGQIVGLLQSLQERLGLSYLFIAHDLAVVRHVAHRVAVMFGGRIVEIGSSAQVFGNPGHPYTRSLLDAVPVPEPALQRARLAQAPVDLDFGAVSEGSGPCVFGDQHNAAAPEWHWLVPGHGVSCRYWPTEAARPGSV